MSVCVCVHGRVFPGKTKCSQTGHSSMVFVWHCDGSVKQLVSTICSPCCIHSGAKAGKSVGFIRDELLIVVPVSVLHRFIKRTQLYVCCSQSRIKLFPLQVFKWAVTVYAGCTFLSSAIKLPRTTNTTTATALFLSKSCTR